MPEKVSSGAEPGKHWVKVNFTSDYIIIQINNILKIWRKKTTFTVILDLIFI